MNVREWRRHVRGLMVVSGALWTVLVALPRSSAEPWVHLDCPAALPGFVDCVRKHMPRRLDSASAWRLPRSEYRAPDEAALLALNDAARVLFARARTRAPGCDIPLPPPLAPRYDVIELSAGAARLCALWEARVDADPPRTGGWGTLIVNRAPVRSLVLGVPHPLSDLDTARQAAGLVPEVGAAAMVVAGSHRRAASRGRAKHPPSDASHNASGYFALAAGVTAAVAREAAAPAPWFLEWHGMSPAAPGKSCFDAVRGRPIDVYVTEGRRQRPARGSFARHLVDAVRDQHPRWHVRTSGDGVRCNKSGTTNVLGRWLNGAPTLGLDAPAAGGFVHIEQVRCAGHHRCAARDGVRRAAMWRDAVTRAYDRTVGRAVDPNAAPAARRARVTPVAADG